MLENLLDRAVQLLWGRGTIAFTLLCGLYFTVFTHFLPLRKIGLVTQKTLGSLFCKKESKDSVSPFAAVSTALGLCWKAGTAAEVIALSSGSIGEKLYNAKIYFQTADLFAWTAAIVLISAAFEKLFLLLVDKIAERMGA